MLMQFTRFVLILFDGFVGLNFRLKRLMSKQSILGMDQVLPKVRRRVGLSKHLSKLGAMEEDH